MVLLLYTLSNPEPDVGYFRLHYIHKSLIPKHVFNYNGWRVLPGVVNIAPRKREIYLPREDQPLLPRVYLGLIDLEPIHEAIKAYVLFVYPNAVQYRKYERVLFVNPDHKEVQ